MTSAPYDAPSALPDRPRSADQALITFHRTCGAIPGVVLGLRQPLVQVEITTHDHAAHDLSALDSVMADLTGEAVPTALAARSDPAALLLRLHHFYGALLRGANIPVFDPCHLALMQKDEALGRHLWRLTVPAIHPEIAVAALQWLVQAADALIGPADARNQRFAAQQQRLSELKQRLAGYSLGSTNMIHFLKAAHDLAMPFEEVGSGIFAIGHGRASRWLLSTITDATPNLACLIASNKQTSAQVLRKFGLPVPDHKQVGDEAEAVRVAEEMGYPVVIKPLDQEQGRGVFAGLRSKETLQAAYREALRYSKNILVERHHEGEDYRLSVMQGRVIKVMHRKPACVVGDGHSTITQLVTALQNTPEQQRAVRRSGQPRIAIDQEVTGLLAEQGLSAQDIPAAGRVIRLRRKSNISVGGTHHLTALDAVHPDNLALAVRVAQLMGLDFAGIDLITRDITAPWHGNGAVICEVNAQPQLGYRDTPDLYHHILEELVPDGGRIPLYLLLVGDVLPPLDKLFALAGAQECNTISMPGGVWRDGVQIAFGVRDSFAAAKAMLLDKQTTAGLMVMHCADVARSGLPAHSFTEVFLPADEAAALALAQNPAQQQVRSLLQQHHAAAGRQAGA